MRYDSTDDQLIMAVAKYIAFATFIIMAVSIGFLMPLYAVLLYLNTMVILDVIGLGIKVLEGCEGKARYTSPVPITSI